MRHVTLVFMFAMCNLFLGCSETSSGPSTSSVIMPLAIGNEWVYAQYSPYVGHGSVRDTMTLKMINEYVGPDSTRYFEDTDGVLMYNTREGLWLWDVGSSSDGYKLTFKYPGVVGEVISRDTITRSVIGKKDTLIGELRIATTNNTVRVPAGTFSCYQYKNEYKNKDGQLRQVYEANFAPNVGQINLNVLFWAEEVSRLDTFVSSSLLSYYLVK